MAPFNKQWLERKQFGLVKIEVYEKHQKSFAESKAVWLFQIVSKRDTRVELVSQPWEGWEYRFFRQKSVAK